MSLSGSPPRWAPTHVQVTVLRAQGLRPKAKGGSGGGSDAYALIALGKEKFATSVSERCLGAPVWREEATFELPPRRPGHGGEPSLQLTVLHRALLGLDKFLGRADISLAELQEEGGSRTTRWYTLQSKPGKKQKERGEIEVDIQFMRSNMTASMFDLSMKDKSRSPFGKLKGKLKGKRTNGLPDTASAIVPSITHSPADSEEESPEKEKKKSKIKTLFSKPGLQKTSLSQSMSVLPAFQPVKEKVRLKPGDFHSNWGDDDDESASPNSEKAFGNKAEENSLHAPVLMGHKRTAGADNKLLNQTTSSNTKKEGLSLFSGLKSKNDPTPRSNVCINGNHVYRQEDEAKKETMPKDNTPSSSPQTFRKSHPSELEENLSSKSTMEHEKTGRMSPSRGLPGSPSLESFKSMTLPSYKLLSGDLLENSASLSLETTKEESREDKKQENKKPTLLTLVTGRKEVVKNSDVENMSNVKEKNEIPEDYNQESTSENSHTADDTRNKKSHNPFDEESMEEQKPEKSAASARTIQTKAVKPRNATVQPFSPESNLNEEQEICNGKEMKHSLNMGESGLMTESKVTNAVKSDSSLEIEPPKPTPRVLTLLPKDTNKSEDVAELNPVFIKPKPAPRNAVSLNKCAPVSLTGRLKDEEVLIPSDNTMSDTGFVFQHNSMNPHENPASDSLLKTIAPTTHALDRDDGGSGCLKTKAYDHDDSLFDSETHLKSAYPVTADQNSTLVGLPVIPEAGSDDELLDKNEKNNEMSAISKSYPNIGKKDIESLSFTEERKVSSCLSSTDPASVCQEGQAAPEDNLKSSKLKSGTDICSANKTSESGLNMLPFPNEHGCVVEEQELKEASNIKENRKSDFFEPPEKSVSFTSPSSSSQLSTFSSSCQSGTCSSSRAESVKKPPADSFSDEVENAGKKKRLRAWVSPSEIHPNQTQQTEGSMSVKQRPHLVKPMNTTASKSHTKNVIATTKMDEKWTESNRKKYNPSDPAYAYAQLTHDELIQLVLRQKDTITKREHQVRELEDYIDNLLVRVMEETPNILRAPSQTYKAGRV